MFGHTQSVKVRNVKNKVIGISGHEYLLDDLAGYIYSHMKSLFDVSHTMLGMWKTGEVTQNKRTIWKYRKNI